MFFPQLWEVYGDRRCLRTFIGNTSFLSVYKSVWKDFLNYIIDRNVTTLIMKESLQRLELSLEEGVSPPT